MSETLLITAIVTLFLTIFIIISYFLNHYFNEAINILNNDSRVIEYFGGKIYKNSYIGSTNFSYSDGTFEIKTNIKVKGNFKSAKINLAYRKKGQEISIDEIVISSNDEIVVFNNKN